MYFYLQNVVRIAKKIARFPHEKTPNFDESFSHYAIDLSIVEDFNAQCEGFVFEG